MAQFSDFIQSIMADGNDSKAFEVFVKWFLKNDPEWSTQVEDIWLWDEWPDKWGPDCGIDLVFKHKNGETQRKSQATLTSDQRQRLESLGFIWDVLNAPPSEGFEDL